jgi:hypothetical protein
MVAWQEGPWKQVERHVSRLQKRMDRATQQDGVRTGQKLQQLLGKSWYARRLAVRRVTHDHRGQQTAGIDGVQSLQPLQRLERARHVSLTYGAAPLRRPWGPQPGSSEQRALGMPGRLDRALQALVTRALEPAGAAKLSPHTSETWRAEVGRSLNATKTRMTHTLDGDPAGVDFLGVNIRQHRVGPQQAGKSPGGRRRRGYTTLIKPAMTNVRKHLAELGRRIRRGQNPPQAGRIRDRNPKSRGWANDSRTWVSQATVERRDSLGWVKRRRWAHRRHARKSATWVTNRYGRRRASRLAFATAGTESPQANVTLHREVPMPGPPPVRGNRSPSEGDGVYGSSRRGRHPEANPRWATRLKGQRGRGACCGLSCQHDDLIEIDHLNGDRRNSR